MSDHSIIRFADRAAASLREEYSNEPEKELLLWLHLALRREAMVGQAYDETHLAIHLDGLKRRGLGLRETEVIRTALASAWAQEKGHASYLDAVLTAVAPPQNIVERIGITLQRVMGMLEGTIVADLGAVSLRRARARIAIAVGKLVAEVPQFIEELEVTQFDDFCGINADLEATAIAGYERMLVLLRSITAGRRLAPGSTLRSDIGRMLRDERYHRELFDCLGLLFNSNLAPSSTVVLEKIERAQELAYGPEDEIRGSAPGIRPAKLSERATRVMHVNATAVELDPIIVAMRAAL
jgi:hypothetical protein